MELIEKYPDHGLEQLDFDPSSVSEVDMKQVNERIMAALGETGAGVEAGASASASASSTK